MSNYLYLIRCNDFFKIGVAGNVASRLAVFQTGNPYPLEVHSCYEYQSAGIVEAVLHQKFNPDNITGEWFKLDSRDLADFEQICNLLGGRKETVLVSVSEEATAEAEAIAEIISEDSSGYDVAEFEQMIAAGWRVEVNQRGTSWNWRRGSGSNRKTRYGGMFDRLPPERQAEYEHNRTRRNGAGG